jgi:hypothetical protein
MVAIEAIDPHAGGGSRVDEKVGLRLYAVLQVAPAQ